MWYTEDGAIFGFQLCYDKQKSERALTWLPQSGLSHHRVDDGEDPALTYKRSPELVADGVFDASAVSLRFLRISRALPQEVVEFVPGKSREFAEHAPKT